MSNKHRLAGAILTASIILGSVVPFPTSAATLTTENFANYSIEQIQTLINKLQQRLNELKKGTACFIGDAELSLGDGEGAEATQVRRLQDFLREKGFFTYKSTGYFGKITRASIIAFQKTNGIAETGIFDSTTKAKMHSMTCTSLAKVKVEVKKVEEKKQEDKKEQSGVVNSISANVSGSNVSWTLDGYSKYGFKIVWSKNSAPTYPTRDGDRYIYLSEPSARNTTLEAFNGSGTYYVRVCEYVNGVCGKYSNQLTTQL